MIIKKSGYFKFGCFIDSTYSHRDTHNSRMSMLLCIISTHSSCYEFAGYGGIFYSERFCIPPSRVQIEAVQRNCKSFEDLSVVGMVDNGLDA